MWHYFIREECFTWQDRKTSKVNVSSSASPMNRKECVARRKYKTQVFLWKKTPATPMDCAALSPAHEVIPLSVETVWLIMTEPSLILASNQSIVYQHPTYLHWVSEIVLKITEHSRLKRRKSMSQQSSSLAGERPSAWWGDSEGISMRLRNNTPPFLFLLWYLVFVRGRGVWGIFTFLVITKNVISFAKMKPPIWCYTGENNSKTWE